MVCRKWKVDGGRVALSVLGEGRIETTLRSSGMVDSAEWSLVGASN